MNYKQTLEYLYAQLPMFHRIGAAAYKKDLVNTIALCTHLGDPQNRFPSIHVAGTNGKGSVSHLLAAVCQAAGLKTGLYISPHYKDFRERIKIDGKYIPRQKVVDFVVENQAFIEEIQPSFFEVCVALAFDYFAKEKVDIAIIEVGLGGRLDSTNVITPMLSVITNISYDHQALLGETLPLIASEKAGIIKPGIPVVIGETQPDSAPVFRQKAAETGSDIWFADARYKAVETSSEPLTPQAKYHLTKEGQPFMENVTLDAGGPYQVKNVATVLQAVEVLDRLPDFKKLIRSQKLFPEILLHAFAHLRSLTKFQGRWQIIGEKPAILCDSAHNEAGIRIAFERIREIQKEGPLHIVTGFVNDKDVDKVLTLFPSEARYYFAKANIPRGLDANILREKARTNGLHGKSYSSVKNALKAAKRAAKPNDLIVVIGSIFVVAELI